MDNVIGIVELTEQWHEIIKTRELYYDYLYSKQCKDFEKQLELMAEICRLTEIIKFARQNPAEFYTKEYKKVEIPSKIGYDDRNRDTN